MAVASSAEVKDIDAAEARLSQDMAAYRRMRLQGLQPQHLKGSAEVERNARSALEVEHPRLMALPEDARQYVDEAKQVVDGLHGLPSAVT